MFWRKKDLKKDKERFVKENQEQFEELRKNPRKSERPSSLFDRLTSQPKKEKKEEEQYGTGLSKKDYPLSLFSSKSDWGSDDDDDNRGGSSSGGGFDFWKPGY